MTLPLLGQLRPNYAETKYYFTQIDSIAKSNESTLDKDSFFVAHQVWYVGSYVSIGTSRTYSNPFEVLFYYKRNKDGFIKKIDNLKISKEKHFTFKDLELFLEENFEQMRQEKLEYVVRDTLEKKVEIDSAGTKIESYTVRENYFSKDHQRLDRVRISYKGKKLEYSFPEDYSEIKSNLLTRQYLFLNLIQRTTDRARKKL